MYGVYSTIIVWTGIHDSEQKAKMQAALDTQFVNGHVLYRGYVDDPRNTDNAWMETVAVNFHDATGTGIGAFHLHAGDDAGAVC